MNAAIRPMVLFALLVTCGTCNHRDQLIDTWSAPAVPSGPPGTQPAVYSLAFQPAGTLGPNAVRGTVRLAGPAQDMGVGVSLASDNQTALSVPPTVVVPAGRDFVDFSAIAQVVPADIDIRVTAGSAAGRTVTTPLSLWAVLPTFFSFWDDSPYVASNSIRRLTPPFDSVHAVCGGNIVSVDFSKGNQFWSAYFQAPKGMPLRVGTYEGATRFPFQSALEPGLDISGEGHGCNRLTGRFIVREAEFTDSGQVRHFWATFEQHCEGGTFAMYGDVRVTDGPAPHYPGTCMR
jgi:hypothetical protein